MKKTIIRYILLFLFATVSNASFADINILASDTTSSVVNLRQNCTDTENCATTFSELLNWTWNIRKPSNISPLLIDVGPGDFDSFYCLNSGSTYNTGFVTIRGSGPENSIIRNTTKSNAVTVRNCTKLSFQDISIVASESGFLPAGIKWIGGGTSTWSNVHIETTTPSSTSYGWYDAGGGAIDCEGIHYWFGSKISVAARRNSYGYKSICGETWFYGGDIEIYVDKDSSNLARIIAVDAGDDIRIFGSTVRAHYSSDNTTNLAITPEVFTGVISSGLFHMHGGIIAVDASKATSSFDVTGINGINGIAHTPMTAFRVTAGGNGTAYRVIGSNVESPFTWPKSNIPPAINSTTGSDIFIETDCDNNGNCNGSGTESHPHMMIYDASCNLNGTWFDIATNQCRQ